MINLEKDGGERMVKRERGREKERASALFGYLMIQKNYCKYSEV